MGLLRGLDAASVFGEQQNTHGSLEIGYQPTHGRLGDSQRIGSGADSVMQHRSLEGLNHSVGDISNLHEVDLK